MQKDEINDFYKVLPQDVENSMLHITEIPPKIYTVNDETKGSLKYWNKKH